MELTEINKSISLLKDDEKNLVSDWYHTFWELYEHRCVLYVALINLANSYISSKDDSWYISFIKSKTHYDWTSRDWWFIVQWYINWQQISYHLPNKYWNNVKCPTFEKADNRDWHTSQDVLDRLLEL